MKQKEVAKSQHLKTLYGLTKMLCNESSRESTTVPDKNVNLISRKSEVKATWTEHFRNVLNRKAPANQKNNVQEDDVHDTVAETAVNEPTLGEVKAELKGLQNGKA